MLYCEPKEHPSAGERPPELDSAPDQGISMDALIQILEATVALRDPYTVAHQRRTTRLACIIATEMDLPKASLRDLFVAGRLHDFGKIATPGEILTKPGKLTGPEFCLIKSHPQVAYDILQPLDLPGQITQIILQHHERLDGSGYPMGLKGEGILLEARILAVADVVDAMDSPRPYRPALGLDEALAEISCCTGTLYDREVVDACLRSCRHRDDAPFEIKESFLAFNTRLENSGMPARNL